VPKEQCRFQTVIKSAGFAYSPYTATEIQGFAQVLADSIRVRIQNGQSIYDQAAAPRSLACRVAAVTPITSPRAASSLSEIGPGAGIPCVPQGLDGE
jgi:hypothetical protein